MAAKDPNAVAAQWASRLAQSTQRVTDGVNAVSVAPGQAAARQQQVWAQNVAASAPKWASRVASVSLQDWQAAMISKGAPRIASGATAAVPKMAAFLAQALPYIEQARTALPPRGTLDQNIARMVAFTTAMSKFQRR